MVRTCEVALPLPLRTTFTYKVPESLCESMADGSRVVVPFRNRAMLGVVLGRGETGEGDSLKSVTEIVDPLPALSPALIELGRWMSSYYLAPIGETFRAMLPPAVEVRFDRELHITEAGQERLRELQSLKNPSAADCGARSVLELLQAQGGTTREVKLRGISDGMAVATRLLRRNELTAHGISQHSSTRMRKTITWNKGNVPSERRGAEQRIYEVLHEGAGPLELGSLLKTARVSRGVVQRLAREGKVAISEEASAGDDFSFPADGLARANSLNPEQARALDAIAGWLRVREFRPSLLYGVTGSGKTEVYLRSVEAALALGRTAIILVPEIALTLWTGNLCRARFGETVAVLHSGLSDQERAREWWRVRRQEVCIVVGTRSAVFAPLENVGVIVVDEEQESSYKQEETPRYNGRDVALMRAKFEAAVALLGSATPSLESYQRAREGKYELLCLNSRVENRPMAAVQIADLRDDFRRTHSTTSISQQLREAIARELASGKQAIVLINRRGYSWFVLCRSCGATILCENCSIALTYHKKRQCVACHYCGFTRRVPRACPKCNSEHIYFVGAGAEQVEEYLRKVFPSARIARLDRDAVRSKRAFAQVLSAFAAGKVDILVGTQMVAKGHDFHGVTLVGVASADAQLGFPDFRAAERTFQLLTQVAGRAGRGTLPGQVIVESYHPEHYAIQMAVCQDYPAFFEKELYFRRLLHYPPVVALASVLVRAAKLETAIQWARQIEKFFESQKPPEIKILGPAAAPLARLKGEYRFHFLLKSSRRASLNRILSKCLAFCAEKEIPDRAVLVDVDPVNLM
ncbi:MAG TPA: primosomal protein N' [Candidatus Acidoferrales bacterium]|nr:primosomal protein N' [Candidatus Acidoferrales bacterium]